MKSACLYMFSCMDYIYNLFLQHIHRHKGKIVLGLFIFIHLLFVHEKHFFWV